METQNITLAFPKDLLRKVKVLAAQRETSVSRLLAEQLERLVERDEAYERARERHLPAWRQPPTSGPAARSRGPVTSSPNAEAREFVDTNVLVYAHDAGAGAKHLQAKEVVRRLWAARGGCVSIQVLQEFFVTATGKLAAPLDAEEGARLVASIGRWWTHIPDLGDILAAIEFTGSRVSPTGMP